MDLCEYLNNMSNGLKTISEDIKRIQFNKKGDKKDKMPLKSMFKKQLYKTKEEAQNATDNPDEALILGKLKDIFEGK